MIRTRLIVLCTLATIAFGHLVSCSGMHPTNKSLYALDPGRPTTAPRGDSSEARQASSGPTTGVSRERVLQVRRANVAPPFDGSSLIYRGPDGTYVKDFYNQWLAAPEELFSSELVNWLSASGPFESVVDGRSAAAHRFALETSITSLYGDFRDERNPKVVLSARVYLIDDAAGGRSVAYQNHYEISVPVPRASAGDLVVGVGRAYRQLLESITQDLSAFRKTAVASSG
jgi:uncharacterized lipoprotein YmbA